MMRENTLAAQPRLPAPADLLVVSQPDKPLAFRSLDQLFATRTIARGAVVQPLPRANQELQVEYHFDGESWDTARFMQENQVGGLLVLKAGAIVLERYALGNDEHTRWSSFSAAKSVVSVLVGAAIQDGCIGGVHEPVTRYLPELRGSGYDGALIRDLLLMASGVPQDENYLNPQADISIVLRCVAERRVGGIVAHLRTLPRQYLPGTHFAYQTGETHLLGLVVAAATGQRLADYLAGKIWQPVGMERNGFWVLESDDGAEFGGGLLAATLRDYGRLGQFMLGGGIARGVEVLPAGWITESTRPSYAHPLTDYGQLPGQPSALGYGYQWWLPTRTDRSYAAMGVFGQQLYINPDEQAVVVLWSAWPEPVVPQLGKQAHAFITAALQSTWSR